MMNDDDEFPKCKQSLSDCKNTKIFQIKNVQEIKNGSKNFNMENREN